MDTPPVMAKQQISSPLLIAGSVLGAMAVIQIVALAVYFANNARTAVAHARATAEPSQTVTAKRAAKAVADGPIVASRMSVTAQPLIPELSQPQVKPTPVPLGRIRKMNKEVVSEMIDLAINNRERGDMMAALTKLREAQRMAPDEPEIIAELALTYEKMGPTFTDKAIDHWARVKEFGESAGLLYEMADQKLKRGVGESIPKAVLLRLPESQTQNRTLFGVEESLPGIPEDATTARLVELAEVVTFDEPPGDAALKRMRLRATVQAKPGTIERQSVQIHVLFFDIVDGKHVMQTAAEVISQWITQPADWADDGVEVLEVDYKLVKPQVPEGEKAEDRKYYGYQVRLYYDNELQKVSAEPTALLNDHPAPQLLTPETPSE